MEAPAQPFELRTVGEIVAEDYRRATALKRHGIDFCCGGGATLAAAAAKAGAPIAQVIRDLAAPPAGTDAVPARVDSWDPGFLSDYIVNQHHRYVREQAPALRAFTQKLARVHGGRHPELVKIAGLFEDLAAELEEHMAREEEDVFPRIKALSAGATADGGLRDAIEDLESEHDGAGALMREIRRLSDGYAPPADACNTYRAAFVGLEAFEDDLHRHVHLENNVLFPRVAAPGPAPAACAIPAR